MSLSENTHKYIKDEVKKSFSALEQILPGFPLAAIGIDDAFIDKIIEDAYLAVFNEEEVEEMVKFKQRFDKRTATMEKLVQEIVADKMEKHKSEIQAYMESK